MQMHACAFVVRSKSNYFKHGCIPQIPRNNMSFFNITKTLAQSKHANGSMKTVSRRNRQFVNRVKLWPRWGRVSGSCDEATSAGVDVATRPNFGCDGKGAFVTPSPFVRCPLYDDVQGHKNAVSVCVHVFVCVYVFVQRKKEKNNDYAMCTCHKPRCCVCV
jgi:hypothetical protein